MAGRAIAGNRAVVNKSASKTLRVVAASAVLGGDYMGRRFAFRGGAIVACCAKAGRCAVIKLGRQKSCCDVADATIFCRGNVAGCFSCCNHAIVTGCATLSDARVIEYTAGRQRNETLGVVAVVTFCGGKNMRAGFRYGKGAVMTIATHSKNICVVNIRDVGKGPWKMARGANVTRWHMVAVFADNNALCMAPHAIG